MQTATQHKSDCTKAFNRKDPTCPRCIELLAGAPARSGWQKDYYERKRRQEKADADSRRAHFAPNGPHALGKCGPVCTFGDW